MDSRAPEDRGAMRRWNRPRRGDWIGASSWKICEKGMVFEPTIRVSGEAVNAMEFGTDGGD